MATARHDLMAPIEYAGMSRAHQAARLLGALTVGAVGGLGVAWGEPTAGLLVAAAVLEGAHALYRLRRPTRSALGALLIDVSFLGVTLVVADLVQAQFAVAAYLLTASILLLTLSEAALAISYGALWAAIVATIAPLRQNGLGSRFELPVGRAAGVVFLILIAVLLFASARFLSVYRRRQADALAAERRAGSLKDQFVSMVSHEFRTPLTSIAGFVEMLRENRHDLDDAEIDEFLNIIHTEARHLSTLVEDVLVIPRLEADRMPFEPVDFDLAAHAERVVEVIFPPGGDRDAVVAIAGGTVVHADANRVAQVLRNLLQNAAKYGGDQILVEGTRREDRYLVVVSDNGPGVPDEHRDRIFEHFEQGSVGDSRTDTGIGLGLPIASRLVEAMGGKLWHEPRFPTGSRFCFTLPLAAAAPRSEARATAEAG